EGNPPRPEPGTDASRRDSAPRRAAGDWRAGDDGGQEARRHAPALAQDSRRDRAGDAGNGGAARQVLRQRSGPVAAPAAGLRSLARRASAQEGGGEDSNGEGEGEGG